MSTKPENLQAFLRLLGDVTVHKSDIITPDDVLLALDLAGLKIVSQTESTPIVLG